MTDRRSAVIGSRRAIYAVALFGCALRLFHYVRDPSMWHDEAALVINVLGKDFFALLGPLEWNEAAPPLFLWLERAIALTFGDSTYALRLIPLLASCLSLLLFAATVRRLLVPWAAFWAIFLFAASDRLSWHAAEAKPYAVDVLVACAALFAAVRLRDWSPSRRLLLLALASPLAILISYPACFVCGALLLYELPAAWRGGWRSRFVYLTWAMAIAGSFAILCFGPIRAQRNEAVENCWLNHFPDWSRPWSVPVWSTAGFYEVARYCFKPLGNLLAPLAVFGTIWLWRAGRRHALVLLAGPLTLAWLASLLHSYPFGASRLEVFAVPGLAILFAAGVEPARRWCRARWHWGSIAVLILLLAPLGESLRFVISPWPRADVAGAAAYILAHRQADEGVLANHWEFAYYLRHQGDAFHWLGCDLRGPHARVWVALTAPDEVGRHQFLASLAQQGRIIEQKEFTYTSVALIDVNAEPARELACAEQPLIDE